MQEASPPNSVRAALDRLGWGVRELYLASFAYGPVGDEDDLRLFVERGDRLSSSQRAIVAATLDDALLDGAPDSTNVTTD